MMLRRKTRRIHVGAIPIGGDAPIVVQAMCKTHHEGMSFCNFRQEVRM